MLGKKTFTISSILLATAGFAAAQPDYFPLQPGNQWIYRSSGSTGSEIRTVEVVRTATMAAGEYALVRGLWEGDLWLRMTPDGKLIALGEDQVERLYADFSAGDGSTYQEDVPPCLQTAHIVSHSAEYSGPIGEFSNALEIRYDPGNCADAGNQEDKYLPGIGLVSRRETTFAGPRQFDLIYARIGDVTVISGPGTGFGLTIDRTTYPVPGERDSPEMIARLTLRNGQEQPLSVTFPTGQRFDLQIWNDRGESVYTWSADKLFPQVMETIVIGPHEEKNWVVDVPLAALPEGRYAVKVWLTSSEPPVFSAALSFEIRPSEPAQ